MNPNYINLENVAGAYNEVWDWAGGFGSGPVGVEIVGLDGSNLWGEIRGGVCDESRNAIFDAGWQVHHFVSCVAHVVVLNCRDLEMYGMSVYMKKGRLGFPEA